MIFSSGTYFGLVASFVFTSGILCILIRKNLIGLLLGIELMLNAANLNLISFSKYGKLGAEGQTVALFVILIAAAEAVVAIALVMAYYLYHHKIDADEMKLLKG